MSRKNLGYLTHSPSAWNCWPESFNLSPCILGFRPRYWFKKKKSSPWVTVGAVMAVKAAVTEVVGRESLFLILWLSHRLMVKSLSFSIQMAERVFTLRNSDRSRSSSSSSSCSNSIDSIPQSLLFFHRQSLYTIKKKNCKTRKEASK